MSPEVLTAEELARCAAMAEAAERHAAEAERHAANLRELRAANPAVTEALSRICDIHTLEVARCLALGCRPGSLEETLARYDILTRATLDQLLAALKEGQN